VIALVRGEVAVRRPDHVVVDVDGRRLPPVGLAETLGRVPAVGKAVTLHTHLIVRDDALQLYGFATEEERDLFLLPARRAVRRPEGRARHPVGRPAARARAAPWPAATPPASRPCPGIGKRTAERIVVELRDKVSPHFGGDDIIVTRGRRGPRGEARDGLLDLGFAPQEVESLLDAAEGETVEQLIQSALRLARR
jgi:Holliday junction DNA helicase RuvA